MLLWLAFLATMSSFAAARTGWPGVALVVLVGARANAS